MPLWQSHFSEFIYTSNSTSNPNPFLFLVISIWENLVFAPDFFFEVQCLCSVFMFEMAITVVFWGLFSLPCMPLRKFMSCVIIHFKIFQPYNLEKNIQAKTHITRQPNEIEHFKIHIHKYSGLSRIIRQLTYTTRNQPPYSKHKLWYNKKES